MKKHTPTEAAILAELSTALKSIYKVCDLAGEQSPEEPNRTIGESHWFCDYFPEIECSLDEFASSLEQLIGHLVNPIPFSYVCERAECEGLLTVYKNGVWAQCPICELSQIVDDISAPKTPREAREMFQDPKNCKWFNESPQDCECLVCDYCEQIAPVDEHGWCKNCGQGSDSVNEYYDAIEYNQ
jgi:hypothetical protein